MSAANLKPCISCPYRRDVPSGIWHHHEYEKLRDYDENPGPFAPFMCHTEPSKLCRGWVSVHCESIAVRLCMIEKRIEPAEVFSDHPVELFESGNKAADHGERQILKPSKAARRMIRKLVKRREQIAIEKAERKSDR